MEKRSSTLHKSHIHTSQASITKLFTFIYSTLLSFFFISFRLISTPSYNNQTPLLLIIFASELLLSFLSLLNLSYRWRPLSRAAFPERLPLAGAGDEALPAIDVLVFTADPKREPPLEVMNTVISAMALDYPPGKLVVYVSDDGGSEATLAAAKEAVEFSRWWVPFCRKYELATRCPMAYFGRDEVDGGGDEFLLERRAMEGRYEAFKERVKSGDENYTTSASRPPFVEIISRRLNDAMDTKEPEIPRLIYVSREKRPTHPHHFKAGAINALLRVSSVTTNAPYILVLDCDMYSNDPSSARQAMCFHLDPDISPSLAFVQFPQKFHNVASNDIYASNIRTTFELKWPGMDGLKGPMVSRTCFYMKRRALYGSIPIEDADFTQMKKHFGPSNELIKSIQNNNQGMINTSQDDPSRTLISEAKFLASCEYELNTSWGHEIGFLYGSVVEDYFTGFKLIHCKGWNSVYCNPKRPAFLGTATTNLNDALVQNTRWQSGLLDVTFSRNFQLVYGPMRMSLLQSLCYACLGLQPLFCLPIWCLATLPQLCLIHGIALYPTASSPWFMILLACFMAPKLKYLQDIVTTGGTIQDWWNEERMWTIRSVTSFLYGTIDAVLKKAGLRQASFIPTNKVDGKENLKLYKMGLFNFQVSPMFLVPLVSITLLNVVAFVVGFTRVVAGECDELLAQMLLVCYVLVLSYPLIEGMLLRKDKGRIRGSVVMTSALLSIGILVFGSLLVVGL